MKRSRALVMAGLALLVAATLAAFASSGQWPFTLPGIKAMHEAAAGFVDARPMFAAGVFFVANFAAVGLSLPGTGMLTVLAGALFGLAWGAVLSSFAAALGSTAAFLVSRFLLRGWIRSRLAAPLAAIDRRLARDGALALFTLRVMPVTPAFLLNLAMGLTSMPAGRFHWVNQFAMLPSVIVYSNLGTRLSQLESAADLASPAFIASMLALAALPLAARVLAGRVAASRRR